jgi:hypothetical protein
MKLKLLLIAGLFVGVSVSAQADAEMDDRMDKMCEKVKGCVLNSPEMKGVPDQLKAAMTGMFDNLCVTKLAPYVDMAKEKGLEKESKACADSFLATSCEDLMANEGEFVSQECEDAQKAAEQAGVDVKAL